ncbi:Uncharacterized protein BM_BM17461 [Brugia malayi]|uniref:IMPDH domain-containing protein n=1 Tax=Brugia malayi TaxID=6279 RepID=A0A4E9FIP7_BRUMA|nr:Uncharacterized protein BM_BM17461 [Brugia malayi]VIO93012.1 Uncharacterized protein BM_BM17461 [Brugia malayi]
MVKKIRKKYKSPRGRLRVAAAVGTGKKDGIERCETMDREEIDVINVDAGVDAMKIRIEPRSICTTKLVTGVGVPQFSTIQSIAKAIAAGADSVMIDSIFTGTDESPV